MMPVAKRLRSLLREGSATEPYGKRIPPNRTLSDPPLRIALVTFEYPTFGDCGGIGSHVQQMAHSLAALGHAPIVVMHSQNHAPPTWDGPVPVRRLAAWDIEPKLPYPLGRGLGLAYSRRLSHLLQQLTVDVIEAPDTCGLPAFFERVRPVGTAVVVRLHCCTALAEEGNNWRPASMRDRLSSKFEKWVERRAIMHADIVTASSTAVALMTKSALKLRRDDIRTIPNSVREVFLNCDSGQTTGSREVTFVGRLEWRKGPDLLVPAWTQVLRTFPDAVLQFVGRDTSSAPGRTSMLDYLRRTAEKAGIADRLAFRGPIEPGQMPLVYQESSVCVFPSRMEGLPVAVGEAMACGKAVVVSSIAPMREMVTHAETGMIVDCQDPEALARAITALLANPELRSTLGARARQEAHRRFNGRSVAISNVEAYRDAIARVRQGQAQHE